MSCEANALRPSDLHYLSFLKKVHDCFEFDWYLEIGCEHGKSLNLVRGKSIAIDPAFKIKGEVVQQKPSLFLFQSTSHDFFQTGFLELLNVSLSFSFIDGLHLIEVVLQDFIDIERKSHRSGVIAIHDCCPFNTDITSRTKTRGVWTGDVWKIIPILQTYRPDLRLTVLGCKPTGLLLIDNLSPGSFQLEMDIDAILDDWIDLDLERYGIDRFYESFEYTKCDALIDQGLDYFGNVPRVDLRP